MSSSSFTQPELTSGESHGFPDNLTSSLTVMAGGMSRLLGASEADAGRTASRELEPEVVAQAPHISPNERADTVTNDKHLLNSWRIYRSLSAPNRPIQPIE